MYDPETTSEKLGPFKVCGHLPADLLFLEAYNILLKISTMLQTMHKLLFFASLATLSTSASALKDASALSTIEYTPELIAKQDFLKGIDVSFTNGGVANIVSDTSVDIASNAETQALRQYANHKNLRIIYTVAEVAYRIIANKKGITTLKDLKGKKIGTMPSTSAAYFVSTYLASAGLKDSDYTVVSGGACNKAPCGSGTLPYMLAHGSVDAVGFWVSDSGALFMCSDVLRLLHAPPKEEINTPKTP